MLSDDWWQMMAQLRSRLAHIDVVNVVCYDSIRILHTHFTDLKAASARPEECARPFPLHPCLLSPEAELSFLRCVARILLLCLLPQKDAKSHTLRCCLTEVITNKVLKPLVEVLSDPDSINRMLLSQLEQREQQAEQQKKAYTYAASYEDFIKLISTSADVNFLKQLRQVATAAEWLALLLPLTRRLWVRLLGPGRALSLRSSTSVRRGVLNRTCVVSEYQVEQSRRQV
ncbi:hypothetical protein NL108_018472 [Boleophthalmus pectinirostris]|nr:hypothetical protein NL108_018472 [Boleophthalmus pectinirostris]